MRDPRCYYKPMMLRLKEALSRRPVKRILDTDRISAAVLVPLYERDGEFYIVFTERTHRVSTHKGQISFPGGSHDEEDPSLLDTALRECTEEVGIACDAVEVLGQLDDCPTYVSHYIISPFVGLIPWPYVFTMSEMETASIIEAPISDMLDEKCLAEGSEVVDGKLIPAYFYSYRGRIIWGATARILKQFLEIWQSVRAEVASRDGQAS